MSKRKKSKKTTRKIGQAAVLSGSMWTAWRQHILKTGTTWMFVAITLTHILCARISEVLCLKASDFRWSARSVTIAALKRQPQE